MAKNRTIKNIIKKRIVINNNRESRINNKLISKKQPKLISTPKPKQSYIKIDASQTKGKERIEIKKGLTKHEQRGLIRRGVYDDIFDVDYLKELNIKYDVVILISSFNRYAKVKRLISQLYTQDSKYKFKIVLLNDGSTYYKYKTIKDYFPKLEYIENVKNGGKYRYWKTINELFKVSSENKSHAILQIDDDYILCENYLDILLDKFFELKEINNRYVGISYHITHNSNQLAWGFKHWVDGGTLFDYKFIEKIKFNIDEISESRWKNDKELSSGVWRQVSQKIHQMKLLVHKTEFSLVKHNGNEDSKMNKLQRDKQPIHTWRFIDDKNK